MGYMKTLAIVMKVNKKCNFECPICTCEVVINKKVIDMMK